MGEAASRTAAQRGILTSHESAEKPDSVFAEQECNRLVWAWQQFRSGGRPSATPPTNHPAIRSLLPWVKKALLVGWWGVVAVVVASVFFFGAMVGGFK